MRWLYSVLLPTAFACLPPLRSNYNFHDVPAGSGFELVEDIQSVEDYFYEMQRTLEAMALAAASFDTTQMAAGFDIAEPALSAASGRDLTDVVAAAKQTWVYCQSEETCTKAIVRTGMCLLPTLSCDDDQVTAKYDDPKEYSVHVEGNTWSIKYSSGHVLATAKVGVAANFITPVTQLCYALTHEFTDPICPQMQTIQLIEPIMPTSDSNLEVASPLDGSFVLEYEVESAKNYFYSMYSDLKTLASEGETPDFGTLGLSAEHTAGLEFIYNKCVSSTDTDCEKKEMYDITCLGPTLDCGDVVKASYLDGNSYRVDTTENGWSVVYNEAGTIYNNVLASASIGEGTKTITPMTQTNPSNPVSVSLVTEFEPFYSGAYDLGTTVTCEFGTPVSACTNDLLSLSGCYSTFAEECEDTPNAANFIDKQCCGCPQTRMERKLPNSDFALQFDASAEEYPLAHVNLIAPGRVQFTEDATAWTYPKSNSFIPVVKDMTTDPEDWTQYNALRVTLSAKQLVPGTDPLQKQRRAWMTQAVVAGSSPLQVLRSLESPDMGDINEIFEGQPRDAVVQEFSPGYRWYLALENDDARVWQAELLDVTISGFDAVAPDGAGGSGGGGANAYDDIKYTFTFNFDNVVDPYMEYPASVMTWSNGADDGSAPLYACQDCPVDADSPYKSGYNAISRRYRGPTSYPQTVGAHCRDLNTDAIVEGPTSKSTCEAEAGDTSWFPHSYVVPRDKVTKLIMLGHIRQGRSLMPGEHLEIGFDDVTLLRDALPKFTDVTVY